MRSQGNEPGVEPANGSSELQDSFEILGFADGVGYAKLTLRDSAAGVVVRSNPVAAFSRLSRVLLNKKMFDRVVVPQLVDLCDTYWEAVDTEGPVVARLIVIKEVCVTIFSVLRALLSDVTSSLSP